MGTIGYLLVWFVFPGVIWADPRRFFVCVFRVDSASISRSILLFVGFEPCLGER